MMLKKSTNQKYFQQSNFINFEFNYLQFFQHGSSEKGRDDEVEGKNYM